MDATVALTRFQQATKPTDVQRVLFDLDTRGAGFFDPRLVHLAGAGRSGVALSALSILGPAGTPAARAALLALARRGVETWRQPALNAALGACASDGAVPSLVLQLTSTKVEVRTSALAAIGAIGGRRAQPVALECLASSKPDLRGYATRLIAFNGTARAATAMAARAEALLERTPRHEAQLSERLLSYAFFLRIGTESALQARLCEGLLAEERRVASALARQGRPPTVYEHERRAWTARRPWT